MLPLRVFFKLMENIVAVIPVFNEEAELNSVIDDLKSLKISKIIIAIDPRTNDNTELILKRRRIKYVHVPVKGYDQALRKGVDSIKRFYPGVKYVLFAETGDRFGFHEIKTFSERLESGADMVMGTRLAVLNKMGRFQKLGMGIILFPIGVFFGRKIKENSPFRMIGYSLLKSLDLRVKKYNWTTEMLVKCLALNLRVDEVPVKTGKNSGYSKNKINLGKILIAAIDMCRALQFIGFQLDDKTRDKLFRTKAPD